MLLTLCAAALLAAAPAGAVDLGVSDSDAPTVTEPAFAGLHVDRVRIVVPYDVATTSGAAGVQRRADFERYLANAARAGVNVLVTFGPSADTRAPDTGDPVAPSADEFAAAFAAFRARYPSVTTIAPWNEPNNRDATGYPLGSQPQLAADYWLRAKQACPSCTLIAGEFAGIPGDDAYVDAYQAELAAGGGVPDVWSFHAYTDVNRFQVNGVTDAPATRYYLSKLQGPWAASRIWIDEIGARYRDASGLIWGDASQASAAGLLLGLATLDPRIDAIYYYNYSNQCATAAGCAVQDRGLVSPAPLDGSAPGYDGANRVRAAWSVIANRGPAILPVAQLPPAVTIETPAQGAALRTSTPVFSGRAAATINTDPNVTLSIYAGAGDTESSMPAQTLVAPVTANAWTATPPPLADGIYTATATQAGNPGSTGVSPDVVFTIDTTPPTTAIVSGPGAVSGAHTQEVAFAASEPGATFTCSVDGRRSKPCGSPVTMRHLKLGVHSFAVRARDAAGNYQARPTRLRWAVVSLARALAPRLAGIAQVLGSGLPLAAACEDRCRVAAQLDFISSSGRRLLTLSHVAVRRTRAGAFALRLRPRGSAAATLAAYGSARAQLTLVLDARGSRPVTVRRAVTLVRRGALAAVAKHGLPLTLACSSACSAPARGATRVHPGAADFHLRTPRRTPGRAVLHAGGPGTAPRRLALALALPR